jgi:hypothetical protein
VLPSLRERNFLSCSESAVSDERSTVLWH